MPMNKLFGPMVCHMSLSKTLVGIFISLVKTCSAPHTPNPVQLGLMFYLLQAFLDWRTCSASIKYTNTVEIFCMFVLGLLSETVEHAYEHSITHCLCNCKTALSFIILNFT